MDSGHHPFSGMKAAGVKVAWHVRVTEKKRQVEAQSDWGTVTDEIKGSRLKEFW